jgi:hypothetical protein
MLKLKETLYKKMYQPYKICKCFSVNIDGGVLFPLGIYLINNGNNNIF